MNGKRIRAAMVEAAMVFGGGAASLATAPTEKATLQTERQIDNEKLKRKVNRLRRRLTDPVRTSKRETARRLRQIAEGQLTRSNGLAA